MTALLVVLPSKYEPVTRTRAKRFMTTTTIVPTHFDNHEEKKLAEQPFWVYILVKTNF